MQTTRQKIIDSLQPILRSDQFVRIVPAGIEKLGIEMVMSLIPPWNNTFQLLGTPEETIQYYFFVDSINCCFWAPKGQERWSYKVGDELISGYYAFSAAIKDAFIKDKRFFDARYLADIPRQDFIEIFSGGKNELLLLEERWKIIKENFSILRDKFGGSAANIFIQAQGDVDVFVDLLIQNFPTFRDQVEYEGQQVYFLKRIQILASDVTFALPDFSPARFKNIENLTIFADYKLPQILEAFGALEYAPELLQDIIEERLIPAGSQKELEIRAKTIIAIERIAEFVREKGSTLTAHEVDWILWVKAKQSSLPRPHHKTLTTFY